MHRIVPLVAVVAACSRPPGVADRPPARALVLSSPRGAIHTMDPARPLAEMAVAVNGRWTCVGTAQECLPRVPAERDVLSLGAGSAVPGLADAHGHVASLGFLLSRVDLRGAHDEHECVARIAERAAASPPGTWVLARGWDQTRWPSQQFPTADELSRMTPDHPVIASRVDGHAVWVNARALAIAGIGRDTKDPPGGRIVRGDGGQPTGVLVDNADGLVWAHVPPPPEEAVERALLDALDRLVALGITSVHDAGVDPRTLSVYRRLAERGSLPIHVFAMIDGQQPLDTLRAQMDAWRATPTVGRLTVKAVKLYADGALGSRGALLLEPYSDDPTTSGLPVTAPEELRARILEVARAGFQPAVHAIGDGAVHEVLSDFLDVSTAFPSLRPRAEHLQVIDPRDVPLLVQSRTIASMQPTHATSDGPWVEQRLGRGTERLRGAYAWRTVIDAGAPIACGSDFPVEEPDPFAGIRSAVLRTWPGGPPDGWMPEQRMTLDEALHCFTTGAAYAEGAEHDRGRIAEGFVADATTLATDVTPAIDRSSVTATIVEGRVAWSARSGSVGGR
jgi:predicted amidohydrolase YtcJ